MRRKVEYKVIAWILSLCLVITLVPDLGFAAQKENEAETSKEQSIDPEDVTKEDVAEKTEDTTTYDLGNNEKMTVFHGGEVRYKNEKGKLVDYDPSLVKIKEGEKSEQKKSLDGYAYENKQGDKKHYLPKTLSEDTPILMENGDYGIEFALTDQTLKQTETANEEIKIKKEEIPTTYEEKEELPINAVYGTEDQAATLMYTSGEEGVKETMTLEEKPESNIFTYRLKLKGMTARKNVTDGGITYYDKETGDITGFISAPWMNDASGKAYSEDITYDLKQEAGSQDTYTLTMTVDQEYLNDEERKYPVTIDPSNTWQGSSEVKDAYIISGSKYSGTNFFESGTKVMPVGKNSTGWHRTLMRYSSLTPTIKGQSVSSAKLTVYETGTGASKEKIGIHRLKEDWTPGKVTWNNKPSYQAAYATITTKKTAKSAHTFDVSAYAKALASGSVSGYGLMLKSADVDNASYSCFYGSRNASSAYRPKLVVTYYSKPTTATSASIAPTYVKASTAAKISYAGISSTGLNRVEYKVDKVTCGTTAAAYWAYTSSRKISSGAALPSLPEGCYKFSVRGVNTAGTAGGERATNVVHVDSTAPVLTVTGPSTSSASPSGVKSPVIKWSTSERHFSSITYSVDGGAYGGSLAASGNQALATFTTSGAHTITLKATDKAGNVATKAFTYYLDTTIPSIGTVQMKTSDHEKLDANWTKDPNPLVSFTGITDNMSIKPAGIQYALVKEGTAVTESAYKAITFASISGAAPYTGSFRLAAADQKLASGSYILYLRAKDTAGNSVVKTMAYKKDVDNPTAKLKVMSHSSADAIKDAKNTVTVSLEVNGTGSPVKKAAVGLYKVVQGKEEFVKNMIENVTQGTSYEWDTTQHENGTYRLKASVQDSVSLQGSAAYDLTISNPQKAPAIKAEPVKESPLHVEWSFKNNLSVKEMQYKIDGAANWTKVANSAGNAGKFDIPLSKEGAYKISFKGVDNAGVETEIQTVTCIFDKTAPQAKINSFARGRIKGTASDAHLKEWSVSCKKEGEQDSAYEEKLKGTTEIKDGELGILNLADSYFEPGQNYELKLIVTDLAGNQSQASRNIYIPANESNIKVEDAKFQIKRPSWYEDYTEDTFVIGSSTESMTLKEAEEDITSSGSCTWYIDNEKAGEGKNLSKDFSAYEDEKAHKIMAVLKTEDGKRLYSRQLTKNDMIKSVSFGDKGAVSGEKSISSEKDIVSLRLAAEPETEAGQTITYFVKTEGSDYQQVEPGKTYYITDLSKQAASANNVDVKAVCEKEVVFDEIKIELDTVEKEFFKVDKTSDFIPEMASAKPNLNDRTYLYWDSDLSESDPSISYNIYHSPDKDFEPSKETLAAENVKAGYYSEINVNYGDDYYYRITVVKRDSEGNIISESEPSKVFGGKILDYNEHTKRLGLQDYWQYEEFNTPVGNGSIEKSKGNFVYQQTDAALPNEKLEVDLTRTYNSQSSEKSAFGLGWSHNYDLQLLNVYDKEEQQFDNVVFKDSTGTINRFVKSSDKDTYISSMGEYITLTKESKTEDVQIQEKKAGPEGENQMRTVQVASQYTVRTKDNLEYRFNGGGQLVYMTEPNGNFLLFEYQKDIGLLSKVITNRGLSLDFSYNSTDPDADLLLVEKVTLPDKSTREYTYKKTDAGTNSLLTKVTANGADGKKIVYEYGYDGADNPNVDVVKDAVGNQYQLKYEDEKVTEALYPNKEGLAFDYGKGENGRTKTVTKQFIDKSLLLGIKEISSETGYFDENTGYCLKDVDANGKETDYQYEDGICISNSWKTDSRYITEDGAIRSKGEQTRTELTELGARRNEVEEVSEDGSISTYEYYADTSNVNIQDFIRHEVTVDADDEVTGDNYYEYDEWGNEIEDYDAFEDMTTISDYYEDDEDGGLEGEVSTETEYLGTEEENQVIRTTDYSYAYDKDGNKTETVTEVSGDRKTQTVTVYDVMGNETSVVVKSGAAASSLGVTSIDSSVSTVYDGFGRAVKVTSKEGNITTVTESTYDDNGTLTKESSVVTGSGQSSTVSTYYSYDAMNRQISKTVDDNGEAQTQTTDYGYETIQVRSGLDNGRQEIENARVTTEKDQEGYITSQTFQDKAGNTVREKSAGIYTDTMYDSYGTAIGTYEAGTNPDSEKGTLTLNVEDENGNLTDTVLRPEYKSGEGWYVGTDSIVTSTEYSAAGKETAAVDAMGNKTSYGYDAKGELNQVVLPDGSKTSYETKEVYINDVLETKVTTKDAKGNTSQTRSNEEGQEIEIKDLYTKDGKDQSIWSSYEYDDKGRLKKKTEAKGNYLVYEYDANNRIAETRYYEKKENGPQQTLETTYSYDVSGNVTKMCDYELSGGSRTLYRYTAYTYNKQNRLIAFSECDGPNLPTQEELDSRKVSYTYDKDGNVTDLDYGFVKDGVTGLTYHYNGDKWLVKITAKGGLTDKTLREYRYDDFGRVAEMEDYYDFANGGSDSILRTYTYDAFGRVTGMVYTDSKDKEVKESYGYKYDKNSNLTEERIISNYEMADGKRVDLTKVYTYDVNGRLLTADVTDHREGGEGSVSSKYAYDAVGNRIKETENGLVTSYTYNGLNQLTASKSEKPAQEEGAADQVVSEKSYEYDRNGNQIRETDSVAQETKSFTYDALNQMKGYQAKKDGTVVVTQENRYNGNGQRIQKKESKDGKTAVRNYYYQDGSVLYTADGEGKRTGLNLMGTGGNIIAAARGSGSSEAWYLYHKDVRESTSSVINAKGELAAAYQYDAFGNTDIVAGADFDQEICYTGQIYDRNTGLYYYNARFYNPEDGRFITQDTYRGESKEPDTLHLYAYCANNPVNYVDPSGHAALSITMFGATIFIVTVCYYTTTKDFQKSWQKALNAITRSYQGAAKSTKNSWKKLCKAVMASFARVRAKPRYRSNTERHHIIARKSRHAYAARRYYENVGRNVENSENLIWLKTGLHKRLHRKIYYGLVTDRVRKAYHKNKKRRRENVDAAVKRIKDGLKALNRTAPF